jgi:hypothetical protein
MAFAPLIIRWGAEASSDKLRLCARCTECGHKGATIQHPGWAGNDIGFAPFPSAEWGGLQSTVQYRFAGSAVRLTAAQTKRPTLMNGSGSANAWITMDIPTKKAGTAKRTPMT